MQRDNEPAREMVKTFPSSRGEFTIQPERSGHYTFSFLQISDANYKKVDLKGPSIDQIVHPPASVDFVHNAAGGRGRKRISSCTGSEVEVEVELKVCGINIVHCWQTSRYFRRSGNRTMESGAASGGAEGFRNYSYT